MEEIAELVGVRPNLLSLAFTDPKLALELLVGPCTPAQYRLQGPGKWEGARETIFSAEDRIRKPLMTREVEKSNSMASVMTMGRFLLAVGFLALIMAYF
jgi:dimethylaniline monooxygenase (N-oxide forming)